MALVWLRRDLRLEDHHALAVATAKFSKVLLVFIFDSEILSNFPGPRDARVQFIWESLQAIKAQLQSLGSDLVVVHGKTTEVWPRLLAEYQPQAVYCNQDYEPKAIERDRKIELICKETGVEFLGFKDQVIFEKSEVLSDSHRPYTVFTPYKRKWLSQLTSDLLKPHSVQTKSFAPIRRPLDFPTLESLGFEKIDLNVPSLMLPKKLLTAYAEQRDFPAVEGTSRWGLHLRFGIVSVRAAVLLAKKTSEIWLSELVWREFFMQILFHFPRVENQSFRPEYDRVAWRNSAEDLAKWQAGETGYPLVDAGMRQLRETGWMHNRVRMVTGSFLTKHLLQHWLVGERYFASLLLDFDLSANNGNWQWVAGTGCDAAPYFRIFNPEAQLKKFDAKLDYVRRWVPEYGTSKYPGPMVDHVKARARALEAFGKALKPKQEGS